MIVRKLPIRRAPFAGVANRTLHGSVPDWDLIGHVKPPPGAPNVLVVLVDDAGFGNPLDVRRADCQTPTLHADGRGRPEARPLPRHGAVLADAQPRCSPGGNQPRRRCSARSREIAARAGPGTDATLPRHIAPPASARILPGQRVQRPRPSASGTSRPTGQQGPAGPFDRWPNGLGVRLLLRPARRREPASGTRAWRKTRTIIGTAPAYSDKEQGLLPPGRPLAEPRRSSGACTAINGPRIVPDTTVLHLLCSTGCSHAPHHVAKAWAGQVQGQVRPGLGQAPGGDLGAAEDARRDPGRRRARRPGTTGVPRVVTYCTGGPGEDLLRPPDGGVRGLLRRTADHDDRPGDPRQSRSIGASLGNTLILWIWGDNGASMEGTDHRLVQRADHAERHPARPAETARLQLLRVATAASKPGAGRAHGSALQLADVGVGGQHARSSGASRWARTWAARGTPWSSTGLSGSPPPGGSARSSRTSST